MRDSGKNKARIKKARETIKEFYRAKGKKKVVISIEGLSHDEVLKITCGGSLSQLHNLFKYLICLVMFITPFPGLKNTIFRLLGMKIGKNVYISPTVYMDSMHPSLIEIGDNVIIGMGSCLVIHERTMKKLSIGRIKIEDNVCIGGLSLIRHGTTIKSGAEIDAMSHITRNVRKGEIITSGTNRFLKDDSERKPE